jgi:crotonobetainyl-CoA:carnitine CoA-transferase CaiB-like acyl-CoA transferase
MEQARIPGGPVLTPGEALELPHVAQIGVFQPVRYPTAPEPVPLARFPVELSASPGTIQGPPPELGEHTDEILDELGYDAAAIGQLRDTGVV